MVICSESTVGILDKSAHKQNVLKNKVAYKSVLCAEDCQREKNPGENIQREE